jgi:SAM-dependent methyltransferase
VSNEKEWFNKWFDSPYYHILYQNRDYSEAEFFLSNLVQFFNAPKSRKIIDLCCGKGRHAIFLNSLGYDVTGVDLSQSSIEEANKSTSNNLHFEIQDLRNLNFFETFDIALNLFTSLGYFNSKEEDKLVFNNINKILKPGGFVLIDFMNSELVMQNLTCEENKIIDGIQFNISKYVENDFIIKRINFSDNGINYHFTEKVQMLTLNDFDEMLTASGFSIIKLFGNYMLEPYNNKSSDRLIIVAQKNV